MSDDDIWYAASPSYIEVTALVPWCEKHQCRRVPLAGKQMPVELIWDPVKFQYEINEVDYSHRCPHFFVDSDDGDGPYDDPCIEYRHAWTWKVVQEDVAIEMKR